MRRLTPTSLVASLVVCLCSLSLLGAPPTSAQRSSSSGAAGSEVEGAETGPVSLRETQEFIFQKLAYDEQYFSKIARYREQGRRAPKMSKAGFQREVARARVNLPVLRRFAEEKAAYLEQGRPFTVPGGG